MIRYLFLALLLVLPACASGDLTPRQQAYDVIGKAQVTLILAHGVVTDPATPAEVKAHIKVAAEAITTALRTYVQAVKAKQPAPAVAAQLLAEAAKLTEYLVQRGYLEAALGDGGSAGIQLASNWQPIDTDNGFIRRAYA